MKAIWLALLGSCLLAACSNITLPKYHKPVIERNSDVQPKMLARCILNGWKGPFPAANLAPSDVDHYFGAIPGPDEPIAKISVVPMGIDTNYGSKVTLRVAEGASPDIARIVNECMR